MKAWFCVRATFLLLLLLITTGAFGQSKDAVILNAQRMADNAPETGRPGEIEIRDYTWRHLPKESLAVPGTPSWIPEHSIIRDSSEAGTEKMLGLANAPSLTKTFAGNAVDNFDPPDPIIAAGPNHVITLVNYTISMYNKAGGRVFFRSFKNWFSGLAENQGSFLFDPKVIYDQYDGHFIIMCIAYHPGGNHSYIFFSVSKTPNPLGDWAFWTLDMQLNNLTRTSATADFPGIGYDQKAIYITSNMLDNNNNFVYAKIRVLKKSQVYTYSKLFWHDFWNMTDVTGVKAMNVQPAQSFGTTAVEYLISTNAVGASKFTLWTIRNAATTATLGKRPILVSSYTLPPSAAQKGSTNTMNTGDTGVVNVVLRNGSLFTANAIAFNWGSGVVSAIRFFQINPVTAHVVQEITFGQDKLFYYYPAVMPDSRGNVTIVFNRSGLSEFAGIRFTGRKAADPPGTLQTGAVLKNGLAHYNSPFQFPGALNPWGDYNGAALDNVDDSIWIFSEYVKSPISWATQVGRVKFTP